MASNFNHNKKRNSALVYEFLVRHMADRLIDRDAKGARKTTEIIQKYFSAGQPMAQEKELFDAIVDNRGLSEQAARKVLQEVAVCARGIDAKLLDIKKSNLIKDVHYAFGRDFFKESYRIPEYRLLASVQLYINGCLGYGRISEGVHQIKLEEGILKYMTTTAPVGHVAVEIDPRIDEVACAIAVKKFAERYRGSFNKMQQRLLTAYTTSLMAEDLSAAARQLSEDRTSVLRELRDARKMPEFVSDKVMLERLDEATSQLDRMDASVVTEDKVEDMLLYWKLVGEVRSNG